MLNFGFGEIVIVLALALVVVGPDRLPEMVRFLGRQYGKLRRASNELRQAFVLEAERAEADRRATLLKERREQARNRASAARTRARKAQEALQAEQEDKGDDPTEETSPVPGPESDPQDAEGTATADAVPDVDEPSPIASDTEKE